MSSWIDSLQRASFRGVPFGVHDADGKFGRRVVPHGYPKKDKPWIEDLGRAGRKISFVGFLISDSKVYGGGDVIAQREKMIAACETKGSGTLVHPTLGRLTVSVPEDGLTVSERDDKGRYFELAFLFLESGDRTFPTISSATGAATTAAAKKLDLAAALDYVNKAKILIAKGAAIVKRAVATVTGFVASIGRLVGDATSLFNLVVSLPSEVAGEFGRYFGGGKVGYASRTLAVPGAPTTVSGLILAGAAARATVTTANATLAAAAAGNDPTATADAAQAAAAAFLAAIADPADALRLGSKLAAYAPVPVTDLSFIGQAAQAMQDATAALLRRAAIAAIARAAVLYQPRSRDDAVLVRNRVSAIIDAETIIAGDAGDDASYLALKDLRTSVVADLNARGAGLPPMKLFQFAGSSPSLVLAQRLYQDPTRADELVTEADPAHPGFMPTSFSALAT